MNEPLIQGATFVGSALGAAFGVPVNEAITALKRQFKNACPYRIQAFNKYVPHSILSEQ